MGITYMNMGRYKDAVTVLGKAVEIYTNFDDAHANLGESTIT